MIIGLKLVNAGKVVCNESGYHDVALYGPTGRPLSLRLVHGGGLFSDANPDRLIPVPPGYAASFNVQMPVSGVLCRAVASVSLLGGPRAAAAPGGAVLRVCGTTALVAAAYLPVFPANSG